LKNWKFQFFFFFFPCAILWCSPNEDHPKEDLAKYGYKQNMKLTEKLSILLKFCLTIPTSPINLVIFKKYIFSGNLVTRENT
jgi:hypothetical protein